MTSDSTSESTFAWDNSYAMAQSSTPFPNHPNIFSTSQGPENDLRNEGLYIPPPYPNPFLPQSRPIQDYEIYRMQPIKESEDRVYGGAPIFSNRPVAGNQFDAGGAISRGAISGAQPHTPVSHVYRYPSPAPPSSVDLLENYPGYGRGYPTPQPGQRSVYHRPQEGNIKEQVCSPSRADITTNGASFRKYHPPYMEDGSDSSNDDLQTSGNESGRSHSQSSKHDPLTYVEKLHAANAYRSKVEGKHRVSYSLGLRQERNGQRRPVENRTGEPSIIISDASTSKDSSNTVATKSSKSTGTRRSSYSSDNTSMDSWHPVDGDEEDAKSTSQSDRRSTVEVLKGHNGTSTTMTVKSVTGNVKLKFGGAEADLVAGAECSLTILKDDPRPPSADLILRSDAEEPLISLGIPDNLSESILPKNPPSLKYFSPSVSNADGPIHTEHGTETSRKEVLLACDNSEEPMDTEKHRRVMIWKGKQADQSHIKDTKYLNEDGYDDEGNSKIEHYVQTSTEKEDIVKVPHTSDIFDPYSSEDVDIFNDFIAEGPGRFSQCIDILHSTVAGSFDGCPGTISSQCNSPETKGILVADEIGTVEVMISTQRSNARSANHLQSADASRASREPCLKPEAQVHDCIFKGCTESFEHADHLLQHTLDHERLWQMLLSQRRVPQTPKNATATSRPLSLQYKQHLDEKSVNGSDNGLSNAWGESCFFTGGEDQAGAAGAEIRPRMLAFEHGIEGLHQTSEVMEGVATTCVDIEDSSTEPFNTSQRQQRSGSCSEGNNNSSCEVSTVKRRKSWVLNFMRRLLRPRVPTGSQRVEWICDCGEELYADFKIRDQATMIRISGILQLPTGCPPVMQSPSNLQILTPTGNLQSPSHIRSDSSSGSSISASRGRSSTGHGSMSSTDVSSVTSMSNSSPLTNFLEICVNTGEYLKTLGEIDLSNALYDGDMFGAIQERYLRIRGFRSKFWLLKPSSISFIRFSVEQRGRVGILQKPLALPPEKEVSLKRWIYDPCPLEGDPPIPEHLFLHYLECNQRSRNLFWMLRMPRKLKTSILNEGIASAAFGWGVHIDEGPNYHLLGWINFFGFMASGLFATVWTIYQHDFQGAFGFACWFLAGLNTLLFTMMSRWKSL